MTIHIMCDEYCEGVACSSWDSCDQPRWKPYPETHPLSQYDGEKVTGEFLVTVSLIDKDLNDDDEVCVATWDCQDLVWRYIVDYAAKYGEHGWIVTAWTFKPQAYINYNELKSP